jgi:hypothetical protein
LKSRRRYLTFSLRTLFVVTTVFAVWLGTVVNRARERREAVKAIKALGGFVYYDWQTPLGVVLNERTGELVSSVPFSTPSDAKPEGPAWLRRLIGDDFFQDAERVQFPTGSDISKAIPYLKRLRKLKTLFISRLIPKSTRDELKAAFPNCKLAEH